MVTRPTCSWILKNHWVGCGSYWSRQVFRPPCVSLGKRHQNTRQSRVTAPADLEPPEGLEFGVGFWVSFGVRVRLRPGVGLVWVHVWGWSWWHTSCTNLLLQGAAAHSARRRSDGCAEWSCFLLILMMLCEGMGAPSLYLNIGGALLLLGRIAHPFGLKKDNAAHVLRYVGNGSNMLATLNFMICIAVNLLGLWHPYSPRL